MWNLFKHLPGESLLEAEGGCLVYSKKNIHNPEIHLRDGTPLLYLQNDTDHLCSICVNLCTGSKIYKYVKLTSEFANASSKYECLDHFKCMQQLLQNLLSKFSGLDEWGMHMYDAKYNWNINLTNGGSYCWNILLWYEEVIELVPFLQLSYGVLQSCPS